MTLVDATWKGEIGNSDWQERVIAKTDAAVDKGVHQKDKCQ